MGLVASVMASNEFVRSSVGRQSEGRDRRRLSSLLSRSSLLQLFVITKSCVVMGIGESQGDVVVT